LATEYMARLWVDAIERKYGAEGLARMNIAEIMATARSTWKRRRDSGWPRCHWPFCCAEARGWSRARSRPARWALMWPS
jgi:hypothetical protein